MACWGWAFPMMGICGAWHGTWRLRERREHSAGTQDRGSCIQGRRLS